MSWLRLNPAPLDPHLALTPVLNTDGMPCLVLLQVKLPLRAAAAALSMGSLLTSKLQQGPGAIPASAQQHPARLLRAAHTAVCQDAIRKGTGRHSVMAWTLWQQ
jgi:hypothetical protein